ncbi:alpha/beta hydrolase [Spongisporangium articulatum]|uniref:Alpha/beta hydrolase n=1 Tax=Spongisporangium articulatum TaxID=3362603 RepID=A0ABW8ASJ1_9ACTN
MIKEDVTFDSHGDDCAAWVIRPDAHAFPGPRPVVVLGHGLGGVRDMGLDAFAERFAAAGMVAVVFDYRHFGDSGGSPRQLLSVRAQLEDWDAAIAFAKRVAGVDPARIAIWGSSFGGGHVMVVAAKHPELAAVVSQCPFTDGLSSSLALGPRSTLAVAPYALRDEFAALTRRTPVRVKLAGPPGTAALMTAPDAEPGYRALLKPGTTFENAVAARLGTRIGLYNPGRKAKKVTSPLFVGVCLRDSVAPAKATLRHVKKAPNLELHEYDTGHFDIYVGDWFETVVTDETAFLTRWLKP